MLVWATRIEAETFEAYVQMTAREIWGNGRDSLLGTATCLD